MFDPSFAAQHLTPGMVDDLATIVPIAGFDLLPGLKKELPMYLSVAQFRNGFSVTIWLILFKINVFCFENRFCPDLFVLGCDCFKTGN